MDVHVDVHVHVNVNVNGLIARATLLLLLLSSSVSAAQLSGPVVTTLTIFAGTETGLWRSADWGYHWERVEGGRGGESLRDIGAVRTILALGPRVYVGAETGLYVSDDFGQIWKRGALTVPVSAVLPSRYPQSDPTVFAATSAGLLRSPDGGQTFAATSVRDARVHRLEWPGPALVIATARGVLVSKDGAATFTGPGAGLPAGDVRAMALSSFFIVDPVLFAAVGATGVHRSSDGGATWKASGLDGHSVTDLVWLGPFLYATSDRGFFRSEDAGRTWAPLGEGLKGVVPVRILFPLAPESGAEAFLGTAQGVYRTADGGMRWESAGLKDEKVLCIGTFPPPVREQSPKNRRR
jgi:photosystem II stability/assembly factor-like uncharacterized protein